MTKQTRDTQGRWVKGVTGNPNGRPPKLSKIRLGDFGRLMNTLVEIETPHGRVLMTREAALDERLWASAMKGNVHAQIYLSRRHEKSTEDKALILGRMLDLLRDIRERGRAATEKEKDWLSLSARLLRMEPTVDEERIKELLSRARKHLVPGNDGPSGS